MKLFETIWNLVPTPSDEEKITKTLKLRTKLNKILKDYDAELKQLNDKEKGTDNQKPVKLSNEENHRRDNLKRFILEIQMYLKAITLLEKSDSYVLANRNEYHKVYDAITKKTEYRGAHFYKASTIRKALEVKMKILQYNTVDPKKQKNTENNTDIGQEEARKNQPAQEKNEGLTLDSKETQTILASNTTLLKYSALYKTGFNTSKLAELSQMIYPICQSIQKREYIFAEVPNNRWQLFITQCVLFCDTLLNDDLLNTYPLSKDDIDAIIRIQALRSSI